MNKDEELLSYVLEQIEKLEDYLKGVDEKEFLRSDVLKDACIMKLLVIGEYSSKISDEVKGNFKEVEWQLLKAARNFYAHAYGGIFWTKVWETLSEDLPNLKKSLQNIKI